MSMTPGDWKRWYAAERADLGEAGLARILDEAPAVPLPAGGALVFPHAKLRVCGSQVAAVAKAVLESGAGEVVALGVLHGGGTAGPAAVEAAKKGDASAAARLRRVHGPGVPGDERLWSEEFSLDNFKALLEAASKRLGRRAPRVVERYPFLAGRRPADLPGIDALKSLIERSAVLVATTDPAHHGRGYGTPAAAILDEAAPETVGRVRTMIEETFAALARRDFAKFLAACEDQRSDFRDTGPAMAALLDGPLATRIHDLKLVDYADVLPAPRPTWVAAALASFTRSP
jgi:hypothetical protein